MTIFFIIVFLVLIIALISVIVVLTRQTRKENIEKMVAKARDLLDKKGFATKEILYVSNDLTVAINKKINKLAIIERTDEEGNNTKFNLISSNFILGITKTPLTINIDYVQNANKKTLALNAKDKKVENLIHEFYRNGLVKKIQEKYAINAFQFCAASDWECSYVWAFRGLHSTFAYYKTTEKKALYRLNLLREFFTIDLKLNYFEAPILGIAQQLSIYEANFLNDVFKSLLSTIKQKYSLVAENKIYFDLDNEMVYLTNGITNMQSLVINEIEDVVYKNDRLTFSLTDKEKVINFPADKFLIEEFENFVTSYNLRKIATKFDYTNDKLINVTENTKFIVDASRDRIVYCAGLNSFAKFSYMTIMFTNLESATIEKSKDTYFVRIHTKDKKIIDVSCNKPSIAQYILAQITTIINL